MAAAALTASLRLFALLAALAVIVAIPVAGATSPRHSALIAFDENVTCGGTQCYSAVWLARTDGTHQRRAAQAIGPSFSPHGGLIAYAVFSDLDTNLAPGVYVAPVSAPHRRTRIATRDGYSTTWSPDASTIAFAGRVSVLTVRRRDGKVRRLHRGAAPAWSSRNLIAFEGQPRDAARTEPIWVMRPDGTDAHPLPGSLPGDSAPAWSPDGRRVAFARPDGEWSRIYTIDADGSHLRQLTFGDVSDSGPAWSPDGRRLLFSRGRDVNLADVYVMNTHGKRIRRIARGMDSPQWQPVR